MLMDIAAPLASHTTTAVGDPMIARVLAGGAIGLGLIVTWLWPLAKPLCKRAEQPV